MKYAAFAVGLALGLTLPAGSRHLANRVSTDAWPIERFEDAASPPAIPGHGSLPRNIILFLADGLGFPHLTAAEVVLGGIGARTVWDRFDAAGWTRSHPTSGFLTDSAASATAFATGSRTYYGGIGVAHVGPCRAAPHRGSAPGVADDTDDQSGSPRRRAAAPADRRRRRPPRSAGPWLRLGVPAPGGVGSSRGIGL